MAPWLAASSFLSAWDIKTRMPSFRPGQKLIVSVRVEHTDTNMSGTDFCPKFEKSAYRVHTGTLFASDP